MARNTAVPDPPTGWRKANRRARRGCPGVGSSICELASSDAALSLSGDSDGRRRPRLRSRTRKAPFLARLPFVLRPCWMTPMARHDPAAYPAADPLRPGGGVELGTDGETSGVGGLGSRHPPRMVVGRRRHVV